MISYCSNVWSSVSKTQMQKVQKLQSFAVGAALGNISKFDLITPHIQKVHSKCCYDTRHHSQTHSWELSTMVIALQTVGNASSAQTSQLNSLYSKRPNTDIEARQIQILGPKIRNMLL